MTPKEKARKLYNLMYSNNSHPFNVQVRQESAKQCALIAVENEYTEKREMIFLLRSNYVITLEKTYLHYIELLNKEEQEVKQEIENL